MTAIGIGFIPLPATTAERTRQAARVALTDYADREGVALRHVYEPPGVNADQTRAAMTTLEDVAATCGARTLVVFGAATEEIIHLTRTAELRLISVPDPARRRSAIGEPPSAQPWVGQVDVELLNGRRWRVRIITLDVQPATVTLVGDDRTLAQFDRQQFREWLHDPAGPLQVGAVAWFVQGGVTCLDVEGSVPYIVPAETVDLMMQVI